MEQELDTVEQTRPERPGQSTRNALRFRFGSARWVTTYLTFIVAANWIVSVYGPGASIVTALVGIGFVIIARDKLHNIWHGDDLERNMALLIFAGSLLSIPFGAWFIARASLLAFAVSETVDTVVYHKLFHKPDWARINGSNLFSALTDSLIFPVLAFGWPPMINVMAAQFAAKTVGGFIWSLILTSSEG